MTNQERSHYVSTMLEVTYEWRSGECEQDQAVDVVADIFHLCNARGWDAAEVLRIARMHHAAEVNEDAAAKSKKRRYH
jgi:hypothetical protein